VRRWSVLLLLLFVPTLAAGQEITLPGEQDSVKFAVIGDSGSGARRQYELAERMAKAREQFPFDTVLMLGDNIYGRERPSDFERKFERPYKPLLDAGVQFFASLGNHDEPTQRFYKLFNMGGERYYTFTRGPIQFFALDTTYMDRAQIEWLEQELIRSRAHWKIAFGHHPIYSSGRRHGSELDLRALVEPLFVRYGVDVVFAGHEHFYERIHPQQQVYYFTSGAAGKLRRGNIRRGPLTAAGFDQDFSFMLLEAVENRLHFQVISRTGATVDQGVIDRPPDPPRPTTADQEQP
jgi:predicted phosphodiesterase